MYGDCTNDANWGCFRDQGNIPPIASARLKTAHRFSFRYGRIEIRAKMSGGDWHWPGREVCVNRSGFFSPMLSLKMY